MLNASTTPGGNVRRTRAASASRATSRVVRYIPHIMHTLFSALVFSFPGSRAASDVGRCTRVRSPRVRDARARPPRAAEREQNRKLKRAARAGEKNNNS
jgi:hypothetical protein